MARMQDKVAMVTGGGGPGAAQCRLLASEGVSVVVADLKLSVAQQLAADIRERGHRACAVHLDIADPASWDQAIAGTLHEYGRLDVLVNNAGIDLRAIIEDITPAQWQRVIDINLTGTFHGVQRAVTHMKAAGGGSIVNIASITAVTAAPFTTAYGASKAGIVNLTKTAALHCAKTGSGVRINCVLPGPIATQMVLGAPEAPASEEVVNWISSQIPMGRLGKSEEIAAAVLFFASDESSFCTGAELLVDGGFTVQ